jgi:hypothetical protein
MAARTPPVRATFALAAAAAGGAAAVDIASVLLAARLRCARAMASSMRRCTATGSGGGSDGLFDTGATWAEGRADTRGDDDLRGVCEADRDRDLEDGRRGGMRGERDSVWIWREEKTGWGMPTT